ncbi:hypothetical protein COCOR_04126 [Corallococcus coralloides DSM 2259]|uniref:DUF2019 domain-containing protein n=1 Tax=Corallococcus coralloides (strain ATCC 25202 / DSM 2259 / NBRC 100086 / M2) TaxID=1144275 RepID=H8MXB9_CORCM|nr:hypothetical protein [Corallococcus coralloides]AFE05648.1 hypothetical protein COCOR_04126 [Corallococcus coralloides DSM 2259]
MSARKFQKATIEELLQWYEESSIVSGRALNAGDSRAANRAADKISGAYRELRSRGATSQLLPLLKSEDETVRTNVAAHALEFAPELGEPVLLWIAKRPGLNGLAAEYVLKAWREGTLKFP